MKKINCANYQIVTPKIDKDIHFLFLSDLHGCYQKEREGLIKTFESIRPDGFLVGGDLLVRGDEPSIHIADQFLKDLLKIAPVYMSFGNHEEYLDKYPVGDMSVLAYQNHIRDLGIHLLYNDNQVFEIKGQKIGIAGLCLPLEYYGRKGLKIDLDVEKINAYLGEVYTDCFQILLAHYPRFKETYEAWGADLVLSGHFHGGFIRLPWLGGVIDSSLRLFPKYTKGQFNKTIVSSGMGEHTLPLRINNPREYIHIQLQKK